MKKRLDVLLTEQGLAPSREKAKALIMAGIVYVNNQKEDKAGTSFPEDASKSAARACAMSAAAGSNSKKPCRPFPLT